ncbi:MAG TPA: hypothetical protein VGO56_10790 [Pyrinomonadaceae bacterium]|jgi:hypothetical protein|nr:hypothetical protein [Pyrinomonadaceae bacterium]
MTNGSSNGNNGNHNGSSLFEFPENLIIPNEVDSFSSKDSVAHPFANLLIKNEPFETDGSSDGSTESFRKRPSRYEHPLWSLGWTDGRLGQPRETNEELLLARGRLRRDTRIQAMKARLSLNETKLPDLQMQVARVREFLSDAMSHYGKIVNDRAGRFHEFSYVLGGFYILVALVLFLSDIPLTLKLVAKGFDLKTEVTSARTGQLLYGVDDLLVQTSNVVSGLWEPLTLALGIALAGVFIKIFLDDVIFRETSEVRRKRVVALSVIGVFFLGTIVVLGLFRSQVQNTMTQNELEKTRATQTEQLRARGVPEGQIQTLLGELRVKQESTVEKVTFVLLTITLPLVSGACFSAGWRRLKDTQRYHQLRREIKKLEQKLETASSSLYTALSGVESAKTWLKLNADDPNVDAVDAETQQELSLYRHGYFRGVNVPETIDHGLTLYDRVQRSAQKILAKRLKERIWSDV